jgi:hypothetical protein
VNPRAGTRPDVPVPATAGYALGELIAQGGMGAVYRARDRRLGRDVVIKVPHSASDDLRRRFAREVAITARLLHPSVVAIHDVGELVDGRPFYVMRLVEGEPLAAALERSLTPADAKALLRRLLTVTEAMAAVHAQGVIHRDLKPANILLGRFGDTVIIDWGLAKQLHEAPPRAASTPPEVDALAVGRRSSDTRAGAVLGTPGYMAPEQRFGEDVDERADVYALGRVLAPLVARLDPRRDAALREGLAALVAEATEVSPERRPADGAALAARLRELVQLGDRRRGGRATWTIGAVVVALVAAVVLGAYWLGQRRDRATTGAAASAEASEVLGASLPGLRSMALGADGAVAGASVGGLVVVDRASGQTFRKIRAGLRAIHAASVDDEAAVFVRASDLAELPAMVRWRYRENLLEEFDPPGAVLGRVLAAGPRLEVLVSASPTDVRVTDGAAHHDVALRGRLGESFAFDADARHVAMLEQLDSRHAVVLVVPLGTGQPLRSAPIFDVTALAWTPAGDLLVASGSHGQPRLLRLSLGDGLATPAEIYRHPAPNEWLGAIAVDGTSAALVASLGRWTSQVVMFYADRPEASRADIWTDLAHSPLVWVDDDTFLAYDASSTWILRGSASDNSLQPARGRLPVPPLLATRADDVMIVTGARPTGRVVTALTIATGDVVWELPLGQALAVRCASDLRPPCVAALDAPGRVLIRSIDPTTGELGAVLDDRPGDLRDLAIDTTGTVVAVAADDEIRARSLSPAGLPPPVFPGMHRLVQTMAFDPRGGLLVSSINESSSRALWKLDGRGGATMLATGARTGLANLRPSPDGRFVVARERRFTSPLVRIHVPALAR